MASRKTTSIGFRFNRNDEDLLTEVNENSEPEECSNEDRSAHQSLQSSPKTTVDSFDVDEKKECNKKEKISAVKEFGSRLKQKSSLNPDHNNGSPEGRSWINDSFRKIQHLIDERKEKTTQSKKEKEAPVSLSFVGQGVNRYEGSSINGDDNDSPFYFEEEASDSKVTTPTNDDCSELRIDESPEDSHFDEVFGFTVVKKKNDEKNDFTESLLEESIKQEDVPTVVDAAKDGDHSNYVDSVIEYLRYFRWNWSRLYYTCSALVLLPAFFIIQTFPFPSFLNGLLFGVVLAFILFGVLCVVLVNSVFVKKTESVVAKAQIATNESSETSETNEASKEIFKDWMYEYLIEESSAIESSGKREKRTRLIYVRLDGTSLRISIPKSDLKRSKLPDNVAKITFANQKHYDFAKMKNKRLYFWLPKTVRNKKKYVFAKKYPLILVFDKCDQNTVKTTKLVLFVLNNRYKEEWYQRFRKAMAIAETDNFVKFEPLSNPPSPNSSSHAHSSTENLRRAQSFSCVTPGTDTRNSQLEFQKNYDQFLNKILHDPLLTSSSSSLLWFNCLVGRVFFDFLTHKHWSNWATVKIQRKLSRIKLPYFIETLRLTAIDLGSQLPRFIAVDNPPQVDSEGLWVDFDVVYSGGLQMTLETKLNLMKLKDQSSLERELKPISKKLNFSDISDSDEDSIVSSSDEEEEKDTHSLEDSGKQMLLKFVDKLTSWKYFQTATDYKYVKKAMEEVSNTPLVLTVNVNELRGTLCINIPKPPSDRLWYGFRPDPKLNLTARPQLGDHLISTHHLLEWIQSKLTQMFSKLLVVPNMDDIPLQIMVGNFNESLFVSYVP